MRLLNTATLELEEFFDTIPEYAILSHTWGPDEVTFKEMRSKTRRETSAGMRKIKGACSIASKQDYKWIWIDTCCIDKRSSAELSEAINSMWKWYWNSSVCYVYLPDVLATNEEIVNHHSHRFPCHTDTYLFRGLVAVELGQSGFEMFKESRWFTRGWTLQELIAPHQVLFLDRDWKGFGTKASLYDTVRDITAIDELFSGEFLVCSIARRMSFAANRETTRVEDRAYSLMGLFDVNMPLLYGEGEKAFVRLQEEIMKTSNDESLFAWHNGGGHAGIFARSPSEFVGSATLRSARIGKHNAFSLTKIYSMTNAGLSITLPLFVETAGHVKEIYCYYWERPYVGGQKLNLLGAQFRSERNQVAILNVEDTSRMVGQCIGLYLTKHWGQKWGIAALCRLEGLPREEMLKHFQDQPVLLSRRNIGHSCWGPRKREIK